MKACSICGAAGEYETRSALIAAQSLYKDGERITRYTHTDDTTIWELSICTGCMPRAQLRYLDDRIRAGKQGILLGLVLFALGAAGVALSSLPALWAQSRGLVDFLAAVFHSHMQARIIFSPAICLILGTAMAIFATARLISWSMSRSRMTDHDAVPAEWIGRCFQEEFESILEMRKLDASKGAKENQGYTPAPSVSPECFPLPAFMAVKQLPVEAQLKAIKANGGTVSQRQWQLVGIYNRTPQDLIADPPPEWRKIMAEN